MKRRADCRRVGRMSWLMPQGIALIGNRRGVMAHAFLTPFHRFSFVDIAAYQIAKGEEDGESKGAKGRIRKKKPPAFVTVAALPRWPMANARATRNPALRHGACRGCAGSSFVGGTYHRLFLSFFCTCSCCFLDSSCMVFMIR